MGSLGRNGAKGVVQVVVDRPRVGQARGNDPMEELGHQVEQERRAAVTKGEGILAVADAVILETEKVCVGLCRHNVAKSVL